MSRTQHRALICSLCVVAVLGGVVACGDDDDSTDTTEPGGGGGGGDTAETTPTDPESVRVRAELSRTRVHLDLLAQAHLADVRHEGLYMDFGTPSRMHYTMGRWHGGFLRDVTAGERDFTRMGTDARAWFHQDEGGTRTLRFRGRGIGSDAVVVYVNGERAGQVDFEGNGVQEHDVSITVRPGENRLMLRAAETRSVEGEDVAAEVDSIWILPSEVPDGDLNAPRYTELVEELSVGGQSRNAIVASGGTSVRWYAEVPEGGKLSFAVGAAGESPSGTARVTVTPEGGDAETAFEGELTGQWRDQLVDLSSHAGDVVQIEMSIEGEVEQAGFAGPAVVVPLPEEALADAEARNVIVLLIDTLRASKLRAFNPRSRVRTPALDGFAEQGAVFEHAQAPENWTKPSVASVLTSLTPTTHNTKEQSSSLPESALMVSEVFNREGFATGSFIANGYVSDRFGFDQGWDHYTNYIREERNTGADNVFREALAWIREHREERFFAYIQTIDPHVPYDPPGEILELYEPGGYTGSVNNRSTGNLLEDVKAGRATLSAEDRRHIMALHDGEITFHDRHFATFLEALEEDGLLDDVAFVITSDHGEEFNEHGSYGHGHSIFQELLHVPLMMRWPGQIAPTRISPTVSTLDIAPTVLEAAGVEIPEEFEGQSLLSTARGHMRPGPAIAFSDKLDDRRVATAAGYKLVVRGNLTSALFNLRTDPGEQDQIDTGRRHAIALRYLRGLMGQHLGAADRGDWLNAGGGDARVLPQAESQIDAELCAQLRQLGYIDARCDAL
ncbi:MAG: sulfatase [Sandaracinaceae bacterium]